MQMYALPIVFEADVCTSDLCEALPVGIVYTSMTILTNVCTTDNISPTQVYALQALLYATVYTSDTT